MKKIVKKILSVVISSSLFFACSNLISPDFEEDSGKTTVNQVANVCFRTKNEISRVISPDNLKQSDVYKISLKYKKAAEEDWEETLFVTNETSSSFEQLFDYNLELLAGRYNFELYFYNNEEVILQTASLTQTITFGENCLIFEATPYTEGEGYISFTASNILSIDFELRTFEEGNTIDPFNYGDIKKSDSEKKQLIYKVEVGAYIVVYNKQRVTVKVESGRYTYVDFDKFDSYIIKTANVTFNTNGGEFVNGYKISKNSMYTELPTEDQIQKEGYRFLGWFTNEDFSGPEVLQLCSGNLYARWGKYVTTLEELKDNETYYIQLKKGITIDALLEKIKDFTNFKYYLDLSESDEIVTNQFNMLVEVGNMALSTPKMNPNNSDMSLYKLIGIEFSPKQTVIGDYSIDILEMENNAGKDPTLILMDPTNTIDGFVYNMALTRVVIPEGVTEIGNFAFVMCQNLTRINIPSSCKKIGMMAFCQCQNIQLLDFSNIEEIGYEAFFGINREINFKLTNIKVLWPNAFSKIKSIGELYIGDNFETVKIVDDNSEKENELFQDSTFVKKISIPVKNSSLLSMVKAEEIELRGKLEIPESVDPNDTVESPEEIIFNSLERSSKTATRIILPEGITKIGEYVFYSFSNLREINIPETVTSIGESAFYGCSNLREVILPETVTSIGESAFCGCSNLREIILPETLTSIGYKAFAECYELKEITIPSNVKTIEDYPFEGCSKLTKITTPDAGLYNWSSISNLEELVITGGTEITENTFKNCSYLKKVTIPSSVTTIADGAFEGCNFVVDISDINKIEQYKLNEYPDIKINVNLGNDITEIANSQFKGFNGTVFEIPSSVTKIGNNAFSGSTIEKIIIPSSVIEIGNNAFEECTNIKEIVIPSSVTSIGNNAFNGCESLEKITTPDANLYNWSSIANLQEIVITGGTTIDDGTFAGCENLTSIKIPEGINIIGMRAFEGCSKIESIKLPKSMEKISDSAFRDCSQLENITIPSNVTAIVENVFAGCGNLTSIELSEKLERISDNAFVGCANIEEIVIPSSVTSIGENAFEGCTSLWTITTPNATLYNWSSIPNLSKIVITGGTRIESDTFTGCEKITEIVIPSSVEVIDRNAFAECTLYCITTPDATLYNWSSIPSLEEIVITGGTEIPDNAFSELKNLYSIELSSTLTTIAESAFEGCTRLCAITTPDAALYDWSSIPSLEEIVITSGTEIPDNAFSGLENLYSIELPSTLTTIGNNAFSGLKRFSTLKIPSSVTAIGNNAFEGCENLESVVIPSGVTKIAANTFKDCTSLDRITILSKLTEIGDYAFENCIDLSKIVIPESVTKIGKCAFKGCVLLSNITIPSEVTEIGDSAFENCSYLSEITIPSKVTSIGINAFNGCTGVKNITIPSSVKSIGEAAFENCYNLSSITIANPKLYDWSRLPSIEEVEILSGVENISADSFDTLESMEILTIPSSVKSIEKGAFDNCKNLKEIVLSDSSINENLYNWSSIPSLEAIRYENGTTLKPSYPFEITLYKASKADKIPVTIIENSGYLNFYLDDSYDNVMWKLYNIQLEGFEKDTFPSEEYDFSVPVYKYWSSKYEKDFEVPATLYVCVTKGNQVYDQIMEFTIPIRNYNYEVHTEVPVETE